jgi:hypothetical protein
VGANQGQIKVMRERLKSSATQTTYGDLPQDKACEDSIMPTGRRALDCIATSNDAKRVHCRCRPRHESRGSAGAAAVATIVADTLQRTHWTTEQYLGPRAAS